MVQRGGARFRSGAKNILFAPKERRFIPRLRDRFDWSAVWKPPLLEALEFLQNGGIGSGLDPNCQKGAEKEQSGAPELRRGQALVEKKSGQPKSAGGTKQLERLRKGDADFSDRHVIQNVGKTNAGHGRHDQDEIHTGRDPEWGFDFSKRQGER